MVVKTTLFLGAIHEFKHLKVKVMMSTVYLQLVLIIKNKKYTYHTYTREKYKVYMVKALING